LRSCSRVAWAILRDNGVWADALKRENVELISGKIRRISRRGIVTEDGVEHPVDVLIYGTGFLASHFLEPIRVTGWRGAWPR
jgi:4-hydroxyacetophenone monooxygenase